MSCNSEVMRSFLNKYSRSLGFSQEQIQNIEVQKGRGEREGKRGGEARGKGWGRKVRGKGGEEGKERGKGGGKGGRRARGG